MSDLKVPLTVRVSSDLFRELEEFSERDMRRPADVAEMLLKWSLEQLKNAGSLQRLPKIRKNSRFVLRIPSRRPG